MDFVIRPYVDSDRTAMIGALVALQEHERAIHDTRLPGAEISEPYFAGLLQELAAKSGAMFVAEQRGRFVGMVAGFIAHDDVLAETPDSNIYGYCSDIYVAPDFRGSGAAQALLDALERHLAAQAPIRRYRISALAMNRIACRSYERAGFVPYEVTYEKLVKRSD